MSLSDQLIVNNSLLVANAARNGNPSPGLMRINEDYDSKTEEERKNIDILLNILNWITQCFVLEPKGDVVAVNLETKPTPKNTITLFLSHNESKVSDAKKSATYKMRRVFTDIVAVMAAAPVKRGKTLQLDQLRDEILKILVTVCWDRISRRLEMILSPTRKCTKENSGSINLFNTIIDHWSKARGDTIDDPTWLSDAASKINNDRSKTIAVVKKLYSDLVKMEPAMQKTVEAYRLETFHIALCRASLILNSPFMTEMGDNHIRGSLDIDAFYIDVIDRIHRRLWKLVRYITGAEAFIQIGIPFFGELLTENKRSTDLRVSKFNIDFKWIFDLGFDPSKITPEVTEPLVTCKSWAEEMLNRASKNLDVKDKASNYLSATKAKIMQTIDQEKKDLNKKGDIIFMNKIHCEVNLIMFSMTNHIDVQYRAIGVSKLMCWSCTQFIKEMEGKTNEKWNISGTSGKLYHQWHIPKAGLFKDPENRLIPGKPLRPTPPQYTTEIEESMKLVMGSLEQELLSSLEDNIKVEGKTHKRMTSDSTSGSKWTILTEPTIKSYVPVFKKEIMDRVLR